MILLKYRNINCKMDRRLARKFKQILSNLETNGSVVELFLISILLALRGG